MDSPWTDVAFWGSARMLTRQESSTGGWRAKSLRQGTDPTCRHAQDIPRRGGGSAGDSGHGVAYGKACRLGVPAGWQGRGKRIKEMAVACSGRGAPAAQWGCHCRRAAQGAFRHAGWTDGTCHAMSLAAGVECRSSHASGSPARRWYHPRRAGILDLAALQSAGTAAAHSPWSSHLVATGHESCGLAP